MLGVLIREYYIYLYSEFSIYSLKYKFRPKSVVPQPQSFFTVTATGKKLVQFILERNHQLQKTQMQNLHKITPKATKNNSSEYNFRSRSSSLFLSRSLVRGKQQRILHARSIYRIHFKIDWTSFIYSLPVPQRNPVEFHHRFRRFLE